MGGGGGGDPGAAARQQEAERQARIRAATETINGIFNNQVQRTGTRRRLIEPTQQLLEWGGELIAGTPRFVDEAYTFMAPGDPANSRDAMYADQKQAIYDLNKMDVDRQAQEAERVNRFGLARSGLFGGSADVDSNAELNRRTNEGLLRTGAIADQSAADFRAADERLRSNLISMAQSGIDTGSAATMALNGLANNAEQSAAARGGATVGSLFDNLGYAYLANAQRQGIASATNPYGIDQPGTVSSTRSSYGGNVSN